MKFKFEACLGCTERYAGCHATCEKYIQENQRYKQEQEQIREAKTKENLYIAYAKEQNKRRR